MGESSNAVGLIPGGIVRHGDLDAAGEAKGLVVRNRAVLILSALNPHLAALLCAMLAPPFPAAIKPTIPSSEVAIRVFLSSEEEGTALSSCSMLSLRYSNMTVTFDCEVGD